MSSTYATLRNAVDKLETFPDGITMGDIVLLPTFLRRTMQRLMRKRRLTLDELATLLDLEREQAREIAGSLVEKGCLQKTDNSAHYRFRMARSNPSGLSDSVQEKLDDLQ